MEFRKTTPSSATKVTETFMFHPQCQGRHMLDNDNMDFPALPPFGEEQRKVSGTARVLGECDHPPHPTAITRTEVLNIMEHQSMQPGQMHSLFLEPVKGLGASLWRVYVVRAGLLSSSYISRHGLPTSQITVWPKTSFGFFYKMLWASLVAQLVKNRPAMQETQFPFLGRENPLQKG